MTCLLAKGKELILDREERVEVAGKDVAVLVLVLR